MKKIERQAIDLIQRGLYSDAAVLLASEKKIPLPSTEEVHKYLLKYAVSKQEYFLVLTMDSRCNLIKIHEVAKGGVNIVSVHPRDVFRTAIMDNATGIILAHNHPGGNMEFSEADMTLTKEMISAGELLKIPVLDHIIVHGDLWISAMEVTGGKHGNVQDDKVRRNNVVGSGKKVGRK